ncbi:MAG: hypothetical protein A4E44_01254 [Methanosaeta sp. PtaB.Bin018]|nr:MAG: hypothetical protein A4E44_01254 [Methanosaeta sp. PtaB.Bin018]
MAVFTPAMHTRNSSSEEGAPRRVAMDATDGETPGIQATTDPPMLPEKTALTRRPAGILIEVSSCLGIFASVDRLSRSDEAPKMPDSRGSST